MPPKILQHVSIWLDEAATEDETFPQALEWAFRLNLPLRVRVTAPRLAASDIVVRSPSRLTEKMKDWGALCTQRGVVLETLFRAAEAQDDTETPILPLDLSVFVATPTCRARKERLAQAMSHPEALLLLCPPHRLPLSRMVVLYQQVNPCSAYLESVVRLCQALEVSPILLIAAHSEREAQLKHRYAEGICDSLGFRADFDFVVGPYLRTAVSQLVSWRNGSHLILERRRASWWQRMNGHGLDSLCDLAATVNVLALPEGIALDVPGQVRSHRLSQPWNCSLSPSDAVKECVGSESPFTR